MDFPDSGDEEEDEEALLLREEVQREGDVVFKKNLRNTFESAALHWKLMGSANGCAYLLQQELAYLPNTA